MAKKKTTPSLKILFQSPPSNLVQQEVRESLMRADRLPFLQTAFSFLATRAKGKVVSTHAFMAACNQNSTIFNSEILKKYAYLAPFALMKVAGYFVRWTNEGKPVYLAFDEKGKQELVYTDRDGNEAVMQVPTHIMLCREYKGKLQPPISKADVFSVSEEGLKNLMPKETLNELIENGYTPVQPQMDRRIAAQTYQKIAGQIVPPHQKKSPQGRLPGF